MLKTFIGMHLTKLFRLVARWLKRTSHIMAIATVVAVAILAGHTASAQPAASQPPDPLAPPTTAAASEPATPVMATATVVAVAILAGHTASAQLAASEPSEALASLKTVAVSEPSNLGEFVKDKKAAIVLGKALFWDMQVGSNGMQACASCHEHAGVDSRHKNQLNPGLLRVNASGEADPDITFNAGKGPNSMLLPEDFPFHKLADPNDRLSQVLANTTGVVGFQGVSLAKFIDIVPGSAVEQVEVD